MRCGPNHALTATVAQGWLFSWLNVGFIWCRRVGSLLGVLGGCICIYCIIGEGRGRGEGGIGCQRCQPVHGARPRCSGTCGTQMSVIFRPAPCQQSSSRVTSTTASLNARWAYASCTPHLHPLTSTRPPPPSLYPARLSLQNILQSWIGVLSRPGRWGPAAAPSSHCFS